MSKGVENRQEAICIYGVLYVFIIHLTLFNFKFVSQSAGHLSVLGGFIHVDPQPCLRNPISFGYLLGPLLGSIIFTDSRII